jgi:hypothetical protein
MRQYSVSSGIEYAPRQSPKVSAWQDWAWDLAWKRTLSRWAKSSRTQLDEVVARRVEEKKIQLLEDFKPDGRIKEPWAGRFVAIWFIPRIGGIAASIKIILETDRSHDFFTVKTPTD